MGGDYNVAPTPADVHDPARLDGSLCYHPEDGGGASACCAGSA